MNWEAMGAIAEAIGAVGVIATLFYLAIQIRTNNKAVRTSTYLDLVNANHIRHTTGSDANLADLFQRGMEEYSSLEPKEAFQVRQLILHQCRQFENIHYQYESGLIEPHLWEAWQRSMKSFFSRLGAKAIWIEDSETVFNDHFVVFINQLTEQSEPDTL